MSDSNFKRASKFIALVLRHKPEVAGLTLDAEGWAPVDPLLRSLDASGRPLSRSELVALVAADEKGRYAFSPDGERIRAQQGHSVAVDLKLTAASPPSKLYHGTVRGALAAILAEGLSKMGRNHVHLSPDIETATKVGARRGKPAILEVDAAAMAADGHVFFRSENGVWLTEAVPPSYLLRHR
ncbi:RNA 2'-phosphotransferase [Paracraurococcus ruber]|uniref:Probable RNA 2'-phosphotransferase n=1 Tax=Paracraurococcus ruber TaxID=77675 RepID=A0ABS1D265_9PROT|nr:RNA 2'-phosphotransferase [Paracraurococcus ruber]MBK1660849.1 RNA 2'-phosphotransferase [Paracraurococcus ruber]TDG27029.1 RNA 2'-phosphotransferase [Paracraurococcus ruber]